MLQDYLSNRKQRTKVASFYSSLEAILSGVPQSSILGPFLFNIFMCDMFLILKGTYFTGYAYDNTSFVVRDNIKDVIKALEEIGESLVNWFSNNEMTLNIDKCHLLLSSQEPNTLKIGDLHINNSLSEKLLGINFDCKLKFNQHNKDICQKASQKIKALTRLAPYMGATKKLNIGSFNFTSNLTFNCIFLLPTLNK